MSAEDPEPSAPGYTDPYEERIVGETEVEFQCAVAANGRFDEDDPEYCGHEPETVELDEPAYSDVHGDLFLPGIPGECPECGNPHVFSINGLPVTFP